jgi:hypothetical protein
MFRMDPVAFERIRARNQKVLIDFLDGDLDLALTFARLSQTERGSDQAASDRARANAVRVIETVKAFQMQIEDAEAHPAASGSRFKN